MGSKAPAPPDYVGAAKEQAAASQQNVATQTQANRPGQSTGFASSQWTQNPDGTWSQNVSLGGPLSSAQGESANQLAANLSQPLDTGTQARDKAVQAMYGAETAQLDPQWRLQQEQSDAQLANEGLSPTSAAARAQNNQLAQAKNQAYSQALANAQQLGNQAQQITFGENVASREMPLQELQGLLGLEAQPGFQGAGLPQTPEYLGAQMGLGNYGLAASGANNQLTGSAASGAGSIAGAVLPYVMG